MRLFFITLLFFGFSFVPARAGAAPLSEIKLKDIKLKLELVASGFEMPVALVPHPVIPGRLLVVERRGTVAVIENGKRIPNSFFIDHRERVASGGEKGLFSLAFHPKFLKNPKLYLSYTNEQSKLLSVVSELGINPAKGGVDLKSEKIILVVPQPFENHNGGHIEFGPDGYLYIGLGDGGGSFDPKSNGQNRESLLGSILRIDVDDGDPYLEPFDNPFVKNKRGKAEIWAYGLRNPWRFSFDLEGGTLYAGDIGENQFEEINIITKGENYGWAYYEGSECLKTRLQCQNVNQIKPIHSYGRDQGKSVTGGYVYRGLEYESLNGVYIFADYDYGRIWGLRYDGKTVTETAELAKTDLHIISFGQDLDGELYVLAHEKGEVYRITVSE